MAAEVDGKDNNMPTKGKLVPVYAYPRANFLQLTNAGLFAQPCFL